MGKQSGLGDHLLVDGLDLSGDVGSLQRIGGGPAALDLTDITQSAYGRAGGLRTGDINFSSWFDKQTGQSHPSLSTLPRTDRYVTYCRGYGQGNAAASLLGPQIGYDGTRSADGSLTLAVAAQSDGYGLDWGVQITPGLRTDSTATSPATGWDGTASTAFGAQFFLHVIAFTGTSVTVKIQDSADNSAFTDLAGAAFVAATAVGAQRIAVAGTVRRYLRAITTGTFSNAVFLVNGDKNVAATAF